MTTTPLPEKQYQIGGKGHSDEAMQAYAAQARADLEAENARLRGALSKVSMYAVYVSNGECSLSMEIVREVDAALKETP